MAMVAKVYRSYFPALSNDPEERFKQLYEMTLAKAMVPEAVEVNHPNETYSDTNHCLQPIDRRLHDIFVEHTTVNGLRKVLLNLPKDAHMARELHWHHLIRTNGEVRNSCGEIARAMAHYRQWKDHIVPVRRLISQIRQWMTTLARTMGNAFMAPLYHLQGWMPGWMKNGFRRTAKTSKGDNRKSKSKSKSMNKSKNKSKSKTHKRVSNASRRAKSRRNSGPRPSSGKTSQKATRKATTTRTRSAT